MHNGINKHYYRFHAVIIIKFLLCFWAVRETERGRNAEKNLLLLLLTLFRSYFCCIQCGLRRVMLDRTKILFSLGFPHNMYKMHTLLWASI